MALVRVPKLSVVRLHDHAFISLTLCCGVELEMVGTDRP